MDAIRILIADDHPLFGDGLRALLESVPDMQVIGEAATGEEVLTQAASLQPDVILMDIKMPGMNGRMENERATTKRAWMQLLIRQTWQRRQKGSRFLP